MKFELDKIYKIVYKDNEKIKSPRGYIVESDDNYITLKFADNTKIFINHKNIISINEQV